LKDRYRTLSIVDRIQRWISEPAPDHLFEVTENSLAAASPRLPGQQKTDLLAERGLTASPAAPNVLRPQLYRDALARSVPKGKRSATAGLVIPDYAVRMAILDFEEFPAGDDERTALLRFRLRKTVPFPIDEAKLSYVVQVQQPQHIEVLAVAIARPILEEYESIFSSAGYRVGLVTPSCLATLRLCSGTERGLTLLAKKAGGTLSVLLLENGVVRLVRCIDLTGSEDSKHATDEERAVGPILQQTVAYAEDQLSQPVTRLLLCGLGSETESLGRFASREFGIPYAQLRSKFGTASQENTGLLGLLEQYAA
jgi:type IV pilus assembly protein PilM